MCVCVCGGHHGIRGVPLYAACQTWLKCTHLGADPHHCLVCVCFLGGGVGSNLIWLIPDHVCIISSLTVVDAKWPFRVSDFQYAVLEPAGVRGSQFQSLGSVMASTVAAASVFLLWQIEAWALISPAPISPLCLQHLPTGRYASTPNRIMLLCNWFICSEGGDSGWKPKFR